MKIAFSDFDGTLYFHAQDNIPQINIDAIKTWQDKGNLFVLCSGRDIHSLMYEVNHYDLTYDYVICNNGGTIFNKNLKLIKHFPLARKELDELVYSDITADSWHILYSSKDKMQTTINSPKSQLLKYFELDKYKNQSIIQQVTRKEALLDENIVQISLSYETEELTNEYAKKINNGFNQQFLANVNLNCIDICRNGITKAQGIKELLKSKANYDFEEILTIGDAQNDVPMIIDKDFRGFSLNSATDIAKKSAIKLYDSVGEMLLDNI